MGCHLAGEEGGRRAHTRVGMYAHKESWEFIRAVTEAGDLEGGGMGN